jgi:hypothetical protein
VAIGPSARYQHPFTSPSRFHRQIFTIIPTKMTSPGSGFKVGPGWLVLGR